MNIEKIYNGNELTIKLDGNLDTLSFPQYEQEVIPELENAQSLVLDFANLHYLSSAGLRVILITQKKMENKGGMIIRNVNPEILNIFKMTGFDTFLNIE